MTTSKDVTKGLMKSWETISLELTLTRTKLAQLETRKKELLDQLETLLKTFDVVGEKPSSLIIPPELMFEVDASIGDAIATLLRERGAMTRLAIRKELQRAGKITTKNARIILANAIKRDTRKRFSVKDGRVVLNEK